MLLRLVIEAQGDPMGVKEDLAMALERYAPAKVVEVAPIYRQVEMAGACGHAPLREDPLHTCGKTLSAPAGHLPQRGRQDGILEGIPTEGVVGPFARADAAFRAAVEANEEIRR